VRTVVDAYARLLDTPAAAGRTFNLCSGNGIAIRDFVGMLERITGHRMEIRVNPAFVRAGEAQRIVGSAAALRFAIGDLKSIPMTTTLADMLESAPRAAPA
jgi:nucleoside-diphosphate-sugar epimerase